MTVRAKLRQAGQYTVTGMPYTSRRYSVDSVVFVASVVIVCNFTLQGSVSYF